MGCEQGMEGKALISWLRDMRLLGTGEEELLVEYCDDLMDENGMSVA